MCELGMNPLAVRLAIKSAGGKSSAGNNRMDARSLHDCQIGAMYFSVLLNRASRPQSRPNQVLATCLGYQPAVQAWTTKMGRLSSIPVQNPDLLTLAWPNTDP